MKRQRNPAPSVEWTEIVETKRMTNRQFHDAILRQGTMPIALLRLAVTPQKLTRDMSLDWKFYGEIQ